MNIDQIQSILGAEIECHLFETIVVPALNVCRKIEAEGVTEAPAVDALTTGAVEELAAPSDPKPLLGAVVAAKRAMHDRGIALAQFKDMFPKFVEAFDALNSGMPASEPTAYLYEHAQYPEDYTRVVSFERTDYSTGFACIPLYAHPAPSPAPSVEQPLTDEQIKDMARACGLYGVQDAVVSCVRALLQSAHTAGGQS